MKRGNPLKEMVSTGGDAIVLRLVSSGCTPFRGRWSQRWAKKKALSHDWDKTCILRYHPSWRMAPPLSAYFIRAAMVTGAGPVSRY